MQISNFGPEDREAFAASADEAFLALKGSDAMVVDVRINSGAYDTIALEVVSHFAAECVLAYSNTK